LLAGNGSVFVVIAAFLGGIAMTLPAKGLLCATAVAALLAAPAAAQQPPPSLVQPKESASVPQAEVPGVGTLGDVQPHWIFVNRGNGQDGARIFDGDTGKMKGLVNEYGQDSFAFDPLGKNFYVAQTLWTKVDRGQRQDMLLGYDVHTLKLVTEVPIPGRMLIGNRTHNLVITNDGKRALIYNMQPSSSVNVVDLEKKKVEQKIELPGCATLLASPSGGFSALCSNGTLATVSLDAKPVIARSDAFFNATEDPIFDTSIIDQKTGKATFLSYSGLITGVTLGAAPKIEPGWSVQEAARMRKGTYTPMDVNWMPGGRQPIAVHNASGRIYLLMHKGEYWSEYEPGEEIWVLDGNAHKLIGRHALPEGVAGKAVNIAVSQDAAPLVFVSDGSGNTMVLDSQTFEKKRTIENSGGGILYAVQP
jgi:methylamine dehydrogenase heavy chain